MATGDNVKARAEFEAAARLLSELTQSFPRVVEYKELHTKAAFQFGTLLIQLGDLSPAETQLRAALSSASALNADSPDNRNYLEAMADAHEQLGNVLRAQGKSAASEAEYRESLAARQRLMTAAPDVPEYPIRSGILCFNLGNWARDVGSNDDALTWYGQSIEVLTSKLGAEPRDETAQLVLGRAYWGRAELLASLQRYEDAVRDWDRASQYKTGEQRSFFRMKRAYSLVHLHPGEALQEAEQLLSDMNSVLEPEIYYDGACVYALLSEKESNEQQQREMLGKRAVELLEKARTLNYFDTGEKVEQLKKDADLDSIRERQDFQQLIAQLSAPTTG
jgi:tetratricopeptide (TPR) repeat protein